MVAGNLRVGYKTLVTAVLLLAITARLLISLHYFDISGDKIYQTAAALQITKGQGYTVPVVNPNDLNIVDNKPMTLWPPAYSALLAVLIDITGNIPLSSFLLDSINAITFLLLIYWICSLLKFPLLIRLLVVMFKATEINDVIFASTPTDYMSLNFTLGAIVCGVTYLAWGKKSFLGFFVLLNAFAPWIRYANIPTVIVLPSILIALGWLKNRNKWAMEGGVALLVALISTGLLLYYNYSRSGELFYVLKTTKGFFPENLKYLPPIVWMSMININFPLTQASLRTGLPYGVFNDWLKITNIILLVLLIIYIARNVKWKELLKWSDSPVYFFLLSGALSIGSLCALALLSISRSRNFQLDQLWTYIEEHRYMLIVTITIMFYLVYEFVVKGRSKIFKYVLLFVMMAETAHGIWIISKGPALYPDKASLLYGTPKTKLLIEAKLEEALKNKANLVIVDEDYNLRGYSILENIHVIDNPADMNHINYGKFRNKKIVFRMKPGHELLFRNFISHPNCRKIISMEQAVFYELDL